MSEQGSPATEILIAQRERFLLRLLRRGLEKRGWVLTAMSDGNDILARMRARPPAIFIVDLDLEPMGGEELCRRLQVEMPQRNFLTCILTSSAEDQYGDFSEWFSNFRLIEKPLSMGTLRNYIQQQLAERAA